MPTAADKLDAMAATYRERNKIYKDNFIRLGEAMHALFPEGLTVNNPADWTRLYFLFLQQVKLSRYATNFTTGGHADSVHDAAVYAAMLEAFDEHVGATDKQVGAGNNNEAGNAPVSKALAKRAGATNGH